MVCDLYLDDLDFHHLYPPKLTEIIDIQHKQQSTKRMTNGIISPIASSFSALVMSSPHIRVKVSSVLSLAFSALDASSLTFTSLHTRLGNFLSLGILGSDWTYSLGSGIGKAKALDTISILLYDNNLFITDYTGVPGAVSESRDLGRLLDMVWYEVILPIPKYKVTHRDLVIIGD